MGGKHDKNMCTWLVGGKLQIPPCMGFCMRRQMCVHAQAVQKSKLCSHFSFNLLHC